MAKMNTEEEVVEAFKEDALKYPKLGTNSGAVVFQDGNILMGREVGCHAYLRSFIGHSTKPIQSIYFSTWAHAYTPEVLEYFRFLNNKKFSPWRNHIKSSEVIWTKKDGQDVPVAVKLTDMNAHGQAVMNFALALRMAYAQPGLIDCYSRLRKAGFTRTESVFLSASFGTNKAAELSWPYIGDYPYDTAFTDMDWEMWKSGSPRCKDQGQLNQNRNTGPMNAIWNEDAKKSSGIVVASSYNLKNNRICNLISEEKEITNLFGKKEVRRFPLSLDKAIEKLRANEEVWKCKPTPKQESTSPAEKSDAPTQLSSTDYSSAMAMLSSAAPASPTMPYYFTVPSSASLHSSTVSYHSAS